MIRTASKNLEEVGVFYKEPTNVVATWEQKYCDPHRATQ